MPVSGVRVGILDSGIDPAAVAVRVARRFWMAADGTVAQGAAGPDTLGHGTSMARLIAEAAPTAALLDAQVFSSGGTTAPAVVAEGLCWLVGEGARLVNLSFGLQSDRAVLRRACEEAVRHGVLLVAAVPVRGGMTYPAAYEGVIRVTADGRCPPGKAAHFVRGPAEFGACPVLTGNRHIAGASVATARLTGLLAELVAAGFSPEEAVEHLRSNGIEGPRRHAAGL